MEARRACEREREPRGLETGFIAEVLDRRCGRLYGAEVLGERAGSLGEPVLTTGISKQYQDSAQGKEGWRQPWAPRPAAADVSACFRYQGVSRGGRGATKRVAGS